MSFMFSENKPLNNYMAMEASCQGGATLCDG